MKALTKQALNPLIENQRVHAAQGEADRSGGGTLAPAPAHPRGYPRNRVSVTDQVSPVRGFPQKDLGRPGGEVETGRGLPGGGGGAARVYVYRWDRQGRKGLACRVTARGTMNSVRVEFADGFAMVTSGNAIRRVNDDDHVALTCANWHDGRCDVCGARFEDYEVSPAFRCPAWRPR